MKNTRKTLHIAILAVCAIVFLICVGLLVDILVGYRQKSQFYESVNEGFETLDELPEKNEADRSSVKVVNGMDEKMRGQYEYLLSLKAQYPNVVGYISVPSVSINYPVVQTDNNDYYLNHLITGEENSGGSIFLDARCNSEASKAKNSVLYGHNMNDRSMFHNVELLFEREAFLDATVEYITEEGVFIYKPLSIYRTGAYDIFDRISFIDDADYMEFCAEVAMRSRFEESGDVTYTADSGIITFVTCTNSIADKSQRYIYQAILECVYLPEN